MSRSEQIDPTLARYRSLQDAVCAGAEGSDSGSGTRFNSVRPNPSRIGDTAGTTSDLGGVPSHTPRGVPAHRQFGQRTRPRLTLALSRPLGRLTRGSDAPLAEKRRPRCGRCLSPAGTSLPPRRSACPEADPRRQWPPAAAHESVTMRHHARSDRRSYGRAQRRQRSARSARRAASHEARP